MSSYKGLIWSLVAIAGTATAATVLYRYATRSARPEGEEEERRGSTGVPRQQQQSGEGSAWSRSSQIDEDEERDESLSEIDYDYEEDTIENAHQQQQLMLITREGNMLLSVFGLVLLILVASVSMILTWTGDESLSPAQLPMFPPLMWIAIGIFTAATVEVLSQSTVTMPGVAVIAEKAVFPDDDSDFEMIRQYNESSGKPSGQQPTSSQSPQEPGRVSASAIPDENEEKRAVPSDIDSIVSHAETLFKQNSHKETRAYLKAALPAHRAEKELLWRLARACSSLVDETGVPEEKKAIALEGLSYAEQAYTLDANSALCNKWMGIMTGTVGNFRDLKEKIAGAYVVRDHIQRAIELDPTDATCHNILGQWCLAFADMTWIEKRAASALFGTPPSATYEEAISYFLAAENISPGFWKKNTFLLAQTYLKMKNVSEAATWLIRAKEVPVKTPEDEEVQREIVVLMKKLKL